MTERIDIPGEEFHIELVLENEMKILVAFMNNNPYEELKEEDKAKIKKDIEDLGKWRMFKELKKELEGSNGKEYN